MKYQMYRLLETYVYLGFYTYKMPEKFENSWMQYFIYSVLWKYQQGRAPSRINISQNKLLGTPVAFSRNLSQSLFWQVAYERGDIKITSNYSVIWFCRARVDKAYYDLTENKEQWHNKYQFNYDCVIFFGSKLTYDRKNVNIKIHISD